MEGEGDAEGEADGVANGLRRTDEEDGSDICCCCCVVCVLTRKGKMRAPAITVELSSCFASDGTELLNPAGVLVDVADADWLLLLLGLDAVALFARLCRSRNALQFTGGTEEQAGMMMLAELADVGVAGSDCFIPPFHPPISYTDLLVFCSKLALSLVAKAVGDWTGEAAV